MKFIKQYFGMTTGERVGTLVLLFIVIGLSTMRWWTNDNSLKEMLELPQWQVWKASANVAGEVKDEPIYHQQELHEKKRELFVFDPNTITAAEWMKLGLSKGQAASVIKFRDKGGQFKVREDVKKLFVVTPELYEEWKPYIALPDELPKKETVIVPAAPKLIDINRSDSTDLVKLPGIGPVLAKRMIAYREKLGGYSNKQQLLEVYGLEPEVLTGFESRITVDTNRITKISINTAQVSDFKKHPYFTPAVAQGIVNYRKQHGPFTSVAGIKGCLLVNEELYRKIVSYLIL
jgi:DNA uptake protein ComE-like DNA-binding protein